jgi:hypothetical protein
MRFIGPNSFYVGGQGQLANPIINIGTKYGFRVIPVSATNAANASAGRNRVPAGFLPLALSLTGTQGRSPKTLATGSGWVIGPCDTMVIDPNYQPFFPYVTQGTLFTSFFPTTAGYMIAVAESPAEIVAQNDDFRLLGESDPVSYSGEGDCTNASQALTVLFSIANEAIITPNRKNARMVVQNLGPDAITFGDSTDLNADPSAGISVGTGSIQELDVSRIVLPNIAFISQGANQATPYNTRIFITEGSL